MTTADLKAAKGEINALKRRIEKLDALLNGGTQQGIEDVESVVSKEFGITKRLLMSQLRDRHIAFPRQVAMFIRKTCLCQSYKAICKRYGKKQHGTVMHACQHVKNVITTEPLVAQAVNRIASKFAKAD